MGSVCCCLHEDWEDYANPNSTVYRNCLCLQCFLQNFMHMYSSISSRRGEEHAMSSSSQGTTSLTSPSSLDESFANLYQNPPRPLPYDVDPRYFCLQRDRLMEKGSSHTQEETEPLRRDNNSDADSGCLNSGNKWNECTTCDEEVSKEYSSRNSLKLMSAAKMVTGYAHIYSNSDDEDVCPTCLEEYTTENPKIVTKCSHHFHLGCIYEWMERSENCPVCGKAMEFDETA
ncbi:E3 ubiquitin-protein ligase At3g02290-like [Impatiens glandulifera]|uniref:E3 ubiquitin-protein ligase At3g02290-like n=1 Tax=Impatiens glandulifera TaxID=253017 RepID=UPI001FB069E5|nr:E3 ubiquitin-protein ligase At3g02290-like [Impatiens glandulifera]